MYHRTQTKTFLSVVIITMTFATASGVIYPYDSLHMLTDDAGKEYLYRELYDSLKNHTSIEKFTDSESKDYLLVLLDQLTKLKNQHTILELKLEKRNMEKIMLLIIIALGAGTIFIFVVLNINIRHAKKLVQEKNEELEEAISIKNRLFSIVVHDLKTPLNSIVGFSSLLSASGKTDFRKIANYAEQIRSSGLRGFKMIDKILEWSRLNLDQVRIALSRNDLYGIAEDACAFVANSSEIKKIRIRNEILPGTFAWCDRFSVESVLQNLLSNAVKFSKEESQIWLMAGIESDRVIVSVIDQGTGIPVEYQDGLLELQYVVSKPGTNNEQGTGLGLTLSREFIARNNGRIWFRSIPGQGSSFFFSLPAREGGPVQQSGISVVTHSKKKKE